MHAADQGSPSFLQREGPLRLGRAASAPERRAFLVVWLVYDPEWAIQREHIIELWSWNLKGNAIALVSPIAPVRGWERVVVASTLCNQEDIERAPLKVYNGGGHSANISGSNIVARDIQAQTVRSHASSDPSMRDRKKQRCVRMTRVDGRDFRSTSEMRAVAVPITERYSVVHECMGSMIHPLPIHHA